MSLPICPECNENFTYEDGNLLICPICHYEWTLEEQHLNDQETIIKDSNGNPLHEGAAVTIIKDLKLSATSVIKQGTKIKQIHLLKEPIDGHDIEAKIDGYGKVYLKSSLVKK